MANICEPLLREQRSIQRHLDELRAEAEQERAAKEAALAEIERLKAQLRGQAD